MNVVGERYFIMGMMVLSYSAADLTLLTTHHLSSRARQHDYLGVRHAWRTQKRPQSRSSEVWYRGIVIVSTSGKIRGLRSVCYVYYKDRAFKRIKHFSGAKTGSYRNTTRRNTYYALLQYY